jgi:hypothetical protein
VAVGVPCFVQCYQLKISSISKLLQNAKWCRTVNIHRSLSPFQNRVAILYGTLATCAPLDKRNLPLFTLTRFAINIELYGKSHIG